MKKEWSKPKLISLYRGRPEEAVLGTCKSPDGGSSTGDALGWNCSGAPDHCAEVGTS